MAFGSGLFLLPFYCLRPIVNSPSKLASHLEKTRVNEGWGRFARRGIKVVKSPFRQGPDFILGGEKGQVSLIKALKPAIQLAT